MHLTEQVEDNFSEVTSINALSINGQETVAPPNDSNSNDINLKSEKSEHEKCYENCMKIFHILGFLLGIRMRHDWNPYRYVMFYACVLSLAFVAFSMPYTAYNLYQKGEYKKTMEPFSVTGVWVSVM